MQNQQQKKLTSEDFPQIMKEYGQLFNDCGILTDIIPKTLENEQQLKKWSDNLEYTKDKNDLTSLSKSLNEPVWDLLERGGKRWRPILCIFIAEAFGKGLEDIKEIGALCEIVHNGTLMVDDIEDNSEVRRDKKCIHLIYGNDIAINTGNFMYFAPYLALLKSEKYTDKQKLRFSMIYAEEMTALHLGQGWDILWHNTDKLDGRVPREEEYLQMTAHKTGVLARLSVRLVCAALDLDEEKEKKISKFAEKIGVAFQIQDDILNIDGKEYLKTKGQAGEDIHEGKMSLIVIHSLQNGTEEQKKRLYEILRSKTTDQTVIDEAIQILKDNKSIEFAKNVAVKLVEEAWQEGIDNILPESDGKQKLKLLAEYNIGRQI